MLSIAQVQEKEENTEKAPVDVKDVSFTASSDIKKSRARSSSTGSNGDVSTEKAKEDTSAALVKTEERETG